ncbi:MAG: hypothetical protein D6726_00510 [Nitrospirae bacterium]|nr:MAG: hypothetical protein D6726_00510 [Nitrospirota bacterium]
METCKGIHDWFYCLRCPFLCTRRCPIEHDDAIQKFYQMIQENSNEHVGIDMHGWGGFGMKE